MKIWSVEEVRSLRRRFSRTPDAELAQIFGCDEDAVRAKAEELALSKDKRAFKGRPMPRWTATEIAELRQDYANTPNVTLARRFRRSVKSVNSKAHGLGLRKDSERLASMGRENVAMREDRRKRERET